MPVKKIVGNYSDYNNHYGTRLQEQAIKRMVKNVPISRPGMKGVWYEGENHEYQVACDGYHAIRTMYHADVEDAPEGERLNISELLDNLQMMDGELIDIPTKEEIRAYVQNTDNKNPDKPSQIFYDLDEYHRVNAWYLRDILECLEEPTCWAVTQYKYYFRGNNGDAMLMGIRKWVSESEEE